MQQHGGVSFVAPPAKSALAPRDHAVAGGGPRRAAAVHGITGPPPPLDGRDLWYAALVVADGRAFKFDYKHFGRAEGDGTPRAGEAGVLLLEQEREILKQAAAL